LNGEDAPAPRYALYYAPRPGEGLAVTASQWLGRDPESGQTRALRPIPGIAMERLEKITAEPRLYGFHGTLKAPIALVDEATERDFLEAVGRFAAGDRTFAIPALELAEIAGFLALVPAARCAELQDLADRCVVEFDEFRRPAEESELARRRGAGLSPRQDELLMRWGYPYVLEQWRFHLTLTARLAGEAERSSMAALLRQRFGGFTDRPLPVNDLCVFRQPAPGRSFVVLARFRLGGGRRVSAEAWRAA
jgi:putative phosphonate metabolism protein